MATKKELQSQLELQQAITKAIREQGQLLQKQSDALGQQARMAQEMCNALSQGCDDQGRTRDATQEVNEALEEGRQRAEDVSGATNNMTESTKRLQKSQKKLSTTMKGALAGGFTGFIGGLKSGIKLVGSLASGLFGIGKSIFNVGKSMVQGFFKMTNAMMEHAVESANASMAIRDAWEEVRESFGNLATNQAKAVGEGFNALRSSGSALAGTGVSLGRIFGSGPDGVANQIKAVNEIAQGMGDYFVQLADQFGDFADEAIVLNKAIGLSGEGMANLGRSASLAGESMEDAMKETIRMAAHMEKKFGISAKLIGKNFDEMAKDFATFGTMSRKEMMATAAFAAKLGLAVKDLQGIVGKTDDFESAAQASADLAATFGMQVDAMELMTADPAEKAMMMRDAFHQAGRSFEDMSRQERARLADLTGMSQEAMAGFMDPDNMEVGLGEFEDAAEAAAEGAITDAEANQILASSIKQLNEQLSHLSGKKGFLGTFFDGVTKGIRQTGPFTTLFKNIAEAMQVVHSAGTEVGKMLGELFAPDGPFGGVMEGLNQYFSPGSWRKKMEGVKAAFRQFVTMMKVDPKEALGALITQLKDVFFGGGENSIIGVLGKGLLKAVDYLGAAIIGAVPTLLGFIRDGIDKIIEFLQGGGPDIGNASVSMMADAFASISEEAGGIIGEIWKGIKTLFQMFWDTYGDEVAMVIKVGLALVLGKALFGALQGTAIGAFGGKLFGKLKDSIGAGAGAAEGEAQSSIGQDIGKGMGETVETLSKMESKDVSKAILIGGLIVTFIALAAKPLAIAMADAATAMAETDFLDVAKVLLTLIVALNGASQIVKAASKISAKRVKKSIPAMLAMVMLIPILGEIGVMLAGDVRKAAEDLANVSWNKLSQFMFLIAGFAAMAAGLVYVAAGVGVLLTQWPVVLATVVALAAMVLMIPVLSELGQYLINDLSTVDSKKAEKAAYVGGVIVAIAVELATTFGLLMGVGIAALFGGLAAVENAIYAVSEMTIALTENLIPVIQDIADKIQGDPKEIKDKLDLVTQLIMAFSPILDIQSALAEVGKMDPYGAAELAREMTNFVDVMMDSFTDFILTALEKTTQLTDDQITRALKIIPLISALAGLMGAIGPPMAAFKGSMKKMIEDGTFTDTTLTEEGSDAHLKIQAWGDSVVRILDSLVEFFPRLVAGIEGLPPATESEGFIKKGTALNIVLDAASKLTNILSNINTGRVDTTRQRKLLEDLANVFWTTDQSQPGWSLYDFVWEFKDKSWPTEMGGVKEFSEKVAPLLESMSATASVAANLPNILTGMQASFSSLLDTIHIVDNVVAAYKEGTFGQVAAVVREYNQMVADISEEQTITAAATLQQFADSLGFSGSELVVDKEAINITMNLNVWMKVDDIAEPLVKAKLVTQGDNYDNIIQTD